MLAANPHGDGCDRAQLPNGVGGDRRGRASNFPRSTAGPVRQALLLTAWVGSLNRGNLLICDRNRRTAVPLFAHEIEFRSG